MREMWMECVDEEFTIEHEGMTRSKIEGKLAERSREKAKSNQESIRNYFAIGSSDYTPATLFKIEMGNDVRSQAASCCARVDQSRDKLRMVRVGRA